MKAFFLFILFSQAQAFELVAIEKISSTKKSFVTKSGLKNGVRVGQRATFSNNKVSLVAKVSSSTREFSVWELEEENLIVPFNKGDIVTYNNSLDSIWTSIREVKEEPPTPLKKKLSLKGGLLSNITATVDNESNDGSRTGGQFQGLYQKEFSPHFYWGLGLRFDQESEKRSGFINSTDRFLGILDLSYHFAPLTSLPKTNFSLGLGAGLGLSSSQVSGENISGLAAVLPYFKVGGEYKLTSKYSLLIEGSFESLSSEESVSGGTSIDTKLINTTLGAGLSYHF